MIQGSLIYQNIMNQIATTCEHVPNSRIQDALLTHQNTLDKIAKAGEFLPTFRVDEAVERVAKMICSHVTFKMELEQFKLTNNIPCEDNRRYIFIVAIVVALAMVGLTMYVKRNNDIDLPEEKPREFEPSAPPLEVNSDESTESEENQQWSFSEYSYIELSRI